MKISKMLGIKPGMTALIGGGGKTTLMYKLANELSDLGSVIICTSTKIYEPENFCVLTDTSEETIFKALQKHRVICVGTKTTGGKLTSPNIGFEKLKRLADYIIVEADGAHRLPLKAHTEYEPVIPESINLTVLVMGADAFGNPISQICHRPELYAKIAGVDIHSRVTPETVKRVITKENLGDCLYINKAEDEAALNIARTLASMLDMPVVAGSLKKEEYICLRS
ncbi:MAG: putative selenium-dependent hydroxylase accessory protein YqeC [Clostridiales bacterium]|nr:putative selenium-dependent hydroxylase accessory protein YqeC [Clostridiales bacterium]